MNDLDKPRSDPSDWFNYGFEEEKWIKFLNKSILMHYEKNLILQQKDNEKPKIQNTANNNTSNSNNPVSAQNYRQIINYQNTNNPQYNSYLYRQQWIDMNYSNNKNENKNN